MEEETWMFSALKQTCSKVAIRLLELSPIVNAQKLNNICLVQGSHVCQPFARNFEICYVQYIEKPPELAVSS